MMASRAAWFLVFASGFGFVLGTAARATAEFVPAQYRAGSLPPIPIAAVSGGEVVLDVHVDAAGRVADINVLRSTPPFTDLVVAAVKQWQFLPAEDDVPSNGADLRRRIPVDAHVLVAAMYRPPTLNGPTLGDEPRDQGAPSDAVAAALLSAMPVYPADAVSDGMVLTEAQVGTDGRIERIGALRADPPFDRPALDALRSWTFRPARVAGRPVAARVYVIFAFRQPVTGR